MENRISKTDKSLLIPSQYVKLIIGIGNPGKGYENTYHNVGFEAVDFLKEKFPKLLFLKSRNYMNASGLFVARALKKKRLKTEQILIAHDDSDIGLGKFKLSFGRGSAGHKGVTSIIESLKTKDFWRLRIGIRAKNETQLNQTTNCIKAQNFVLKKIAEKDKKDIYKTLEEAAFKIQEISD